MSEYFFEAATIEEAKDKACAELNKDSFDLVFDIVTLPKKGFLGIGGCDAKIKVTIEDEKPKEKKAPKKKAPKGETKEENKPEKEEKKKEPIVLSGGKVSELTAEELEYIKDAVAFLEQIVDKAEAGEVKVSPKKVEDTIVLELVGENASVLIGHYGETLEALTQLVGLTCNRNRNAYKRVVVDCENYREKRAVNLDAYAKKIAKEVVRTGRRKVLDPMNPYERRIVHSAVSEIEGATSSSIGEEPYRKVQISSKNGTNRRRKNGNKKPYQPKNDETVKVDGPKATKATEGENLSLYTKF